MGDANRIVYFCFMQWVLFPFKIIWKVWFLIIMLVATLFFYPFMLIFIWGLKWYHFTYYFIYKPWATFLCIGAGIIPWSINKKNIPKGPVVFVANHASQLDIVVPYTVIWQHYAFLAKAELKKVPLFNINFKGMNVTVDRQNIISGSESLKECTDKLKKGISLMIFPEGTRSRTAPEMRKFKAGPFKLAIENKVPIVPLVFLDNYKRLQGGAGLHGKCGPGVSRMVFLEPISTSDFNMDDLDDLMQSTRRKMEQTLKTYKQL